MQPLIQPAASASRADITSLPRDIFLIILRSLHFEDVVYCRRVSKSWNTTFSNPSNLYPLLMSAFPLAREIRQHHRDQLASNERGILPHDDHWRRVFNKVSARYYHLSRGKPQSIERHKIWPTYNEDAELSCRLYPVQPWETHCSHAYMKPDHIFGEAFWTYDDGLLVFVSVTENCIVLRDLETNQLLPVPFDMKQKVIRRIRLQCRLLVIEWAESDAFHWLNDVDSVHRHFASSFDINASPSGGWGIAFRNEWKIMFLGHPLSDRDRFYSTHNGKHYVVYNWQPNRSLYTSDEDAPIESMFVWDISASSSYRPSMDPSGLDKPAQGPLVVAKFSFRDLDFHGVRQRGQPNLARLDINSEIGVLDITGNFYSYEPGDTSISWTVRITSIPFISHGPSWQRNVDMLFPPYRGNSSMYNSPLGEFPGFPGWFLCISQAIDEEAKVTFSLGFAKAVNKFQQFTPTKILIRGPNITSQLDQSLSSELEWKGKICGDERFVMGESDVQELVILRFDR
ncbi:hypothetical protein FQN52_005616 [Onygenales sp. PD_12]|nr:hypothetical protein FQN52_005616 [Onygenales sp. PD_12]